MSAFETYALFGAPILMFLAGCFAAWISRRHDVASGGD